MTFIILSDEKDKIMGWGVGFVFQLSNLLKAKENYNPIYITQLGISIFSNFSKRVKTDDVVVFIVYIIFKVYQIWLLIQDNRNCIH